MWSPVIVALTVIPKRRAAARYGTVPRGLPYRAAKRQCCTTVNIKRRLIFGVAEQRSANQRWADYHMLRSRSSPDFFELSKSNHSPKIFQVQKCTISFPLTQSKSCPDPKFWSALHSGSNPNSTKFAIVRIQSNPSLVHLCCGPTLARRRVQKTW